MSEPVGSSLPLPSPQTAFDIPLIAQQLQEKISALSNTLEKVMTDPSLATQSSFLTTFANQTNQLNQVVEQSLKVR